MREIAGSRAEQTQPHINASRLLDWTWAVTLLVLLAITAYKVNPKNLCAYMGTDFRGYYTSVQIALERGFGAVYDPEIQGEYQSALAHPCAPDSLPPMERVAMPYLPLFVALFLPLRAISFTAGYLTWVTINLALLVFYLLRFSKAAGVSLSALRLLQWVVCLPLLANLYLGQMNVLLLLCLGEFTLALLKDRRTRGGMWLAGLLIKPHTLILLLPGLLISRNWGVVRGFLAGALIVLGGSLAIGGLEGVRSSLDLALKFAGPLIRTAPTMMNWRALALNLSEVIPGRFAWATALAGMALVGGVVMVLWLRRSGRSGAGMVLLVFATYAGTLTIAWHSHFYLLAPLIPLLAYLDGKGILPLSVRSAWLLGPPLWYLLVYLADPSLARILFGLGMLALSLYLLAWASLRLLSAPEGVYIAVRDVGPM